tara:strand:+ start:2405 stop:2719 length:315 start_codon:yes stop_codon:yes gene_type:complete
MSKFSEAAGLPITSHETGTTAPAVPPAPPVVEETPPTPPVYENPLDEMPVATEAPAPEIPTNLKWLSKIKLEEIGRTVGIELDRRLSQPKLVEQLEEHIANMDS